MSLDFKFQNKICHNFLIQTLTEKGLTLRIRKVTSCSDSKKNDILVLASMGPEFNSDGEYLEKKKQWN